MLDLITVSGILASLAAINYFLIQYNGTDAVMLVSTNPTWVMVARYVIALAGLYFLLYAVTILPKVPKVKMI